MSFSSSTAVETNHRFFNSKNRELQALPFSERLSKDPKAIRMARDVAWWSYKLLEVQGVKSTFKDLPDGKAIVVIKALDPELDPQVHELNRIAYRIKNKYGYELQFDPLNLKATNSTAYCDFGNKIIGVSSVLASVAKIDSSLIHEIRHMHQDQIRQASQFFGLGDALHSVWIIPAEGKSLPLLSYQKHVRLDEMMSHLGDIILQNQSARRDFKRLQDQEAKLQSLAADIASYELYLENQRQSLESLKKSPWRWLSWPGSLQAKTDTLTKSIQEAQIFLPALHKEKSALNERIQRISANLMAQMRANLLAKSDSSNLIEGVARLLQQLGKGYEKHYSQRWSSSSPYATVHRFDKDLVYKLGSRIRDEQNTKIQFEVRKNKVEGQVPSLKFRYTVTEFSAKDPTQIVHEYHFDLTVADAKLVEAFNTQEVFFADRDLSIAGGYSLKNLQELDPLTYNFHGMDQIFSHARNQLIVLGNMGNQLQALMHKLRLAQFENDFENYSNTLREIRALLLQTYYPSGRHQHSP